MERPYLENSTKQSAKHVGFKKEMHSQRLVQTNLAYTSQSLRQPMKPLLLAAVSSHKQQSNVEHHRQKHSSSESITDRGRSNSISLAASKHFVREQERYLSNSGTLTSIDSNMSFDEVKTGTSKKQKKYFTHGEENLSPIQLSSQEVCDSHFKVSASQYDSLIIGSPNRPVTPGDLANVYRPSLDRRSNALRSILKSSQTSASLHRSMLSLGDSNYKAKHASSETASISPLRFSTYNHVNLPSGDGREEWSSEAYSDVWKHQNVPIIPNCDSFVANNNRKGYYPVWDACPLCLSTKYQICPGLTCVCSRCENADSCMTCTEAEVLTDDYHSPSPFITTGRKTMSLTESLTIPDQDTKNTHHSHSAACQRSADFLCNFPIKSMNLTHQVSEMETDQRVSVDGEQPGVEDPFSNTVENRKDLSDKYSDYHLHSSMKFQAKSIHSVSIVNTYTKQHRDPNDLWIQDTAQCLALPGLPQTHNESTSSPENLCSEAQEEERSDLRPTGIGSRTPRIKPVSGYSKKSTSQEGETFNLKSEDHNRSHCWEHGPMLMEPFVGNVPTDHFRPTSPLGDSQQLQSTEPRGFPLDGGWTKRPVKRYLKLYHHWLLLRCLSAWNCFVQQRYAAAVSLQERQLLRKGLHALHWAVQFTQIQEKLLERRQRARLLAHSFKRWRLAARPSQCQLVAGAPNTTDKFCAIHPRKPVTLQLIRTKIYKLWRNQQEAAQLLSLASLHGHACFDAWACFCGQKIACQQALERRQIESLRSFFLQWRTMLQLKLGEKVHLFQLCHTQTHQQTTAFACWSHGKDDVFIQDGVSETCIEAENIQVSCREPRSLDGICPDETLQDWRKDTYKVQLNRIPTWSRLQDALQLWPEEPFQPHLRFSKHLPQQDCTVTLVDTEESSDTNCSCPEQGTELRPHRLHETIPANRVDLEKAGKWLQHKVEKHLVEQHLACWAARFRQVRRVERFHQWSLLARVFLSWSQWKQGRCRTRELIERFSFVRQCRVVLSLWKMRLLQKLEADRRCREILHQQIQKAMTQWHTYTRNRRQLCELQACFQSIQEQKVKLLILSNWQQKTERQRNMKLVADEMVQRRYLQAWYLVTLRTEERRQNLWAFQTGQTRRALWRVFSWWKYCCELRRYSEYHRQLQTAQRAAHCWKQKMLLGRAIRHRHTILTQIFFRSWKEAVRLFQLSYQFAVNIEERRLRLLLNAWANLVKERKTIDVQLNLIISAAQQRVMQAAFHQMVALYRKQKEVVKFYHLTLLRRSLLSWAEFVHQQKQWALTVSSQVSVLQLRSVFVMWINQLILHRKLILMVQKRNERILQKALRSWYKEMQAVRHHSRYVSQKFVSRWVLNVLARKPENLWNRVEYQAEEHYRNQLCKRFLIIWRHKTLLQQFREKKRFEEMQVIWEQWRGFTVNMLVTRGLFQQRLEGKAWQMWRRRFVQTQVSRAFAAQDDRILMSDGSWNSHQKQEQVAGTLDDFPSLLRPIVVPTAVLDEISHRLRMEPVPFFGSVTLGFHCLVQLDCCKTGRG
ncbi:uncharacterized protein [Scyliorhinus torazame]